MGLGHLDVVAEDLVVAHLQRADAGALALVGLEPGDPALALATDRPQFIEISAVTVTDNAAFAQNDGWFIDQGFINQLNQVRHRVDAVTELSGIIALQGFHLRQQVGQAAQRVAQGNQVPAVGIGHGDLAVQAFEIIDAIEGLADVLAYQCRAGKLLDRRQPLPDPFDINQRLVDPLPQQPAPHRCDRPIQNAEQ